MENLEYDCHMWASWALYVPIAVLVLGHERSAGGGGGVGGVDTARAEAHGGNMPGVSEEQQRCRESQVVSGDAQPRRPL